MRDWSTLGMCCCTFFRYVWWSCFQFMRCFLGHLNVVKWFVHYSVIIGGEHKQISYNYDVWAYSMNIQYCIYIVNTYFVSIQCSHTKQHLTCQTISTQKSSHEALRGHVPLKLWHVLSMSISRRNWRSVRAMVRVKRGSLDVLRGWNVVFSMLHASKLLRIWYAIFCHANHEDKEKRC